jgi:hypothetical protein
MTAMSDGEARELLGRLTEQAVDEDRPNAAGRLLELVGQLPAPARETVERVLLRSYVEDLVREFLDEEVTAGRAVEVEPGIYQRTT